MKNKGFTLIELLAVIVILAIIAVITTPVILGVMEKSKKGALIESVNGILDTAEKYQMTSELNEEEYETNIDLTGATLSYKGRKPEKGVLVIEKAGIYIIALYDNYCIEKNYNEKSPKIVDMKKCENMVLPKKGPTKVEALEGETHKGIVYLDPTNLTKTCNVTNSTSTTETKTGCMKWYIYEDSEDTYKMILDHNTTARIKWNDENSNVSYEESNLKAVVDDLVTTSKWKVTPSLISVSEINSITGKEDFDSSNLDSWYYLDTLSHERKTFLENEKSKYDWLYNNLNKCKSSQGNYGCTIVDSNIYPGYGTAGEGPTDAYWMSTTLGIEKPDFKVWYVNWMGLLDCTSSNDARRGIRPVIVISKSLFQG